MKNILIVSLIAFNCLLLSSCTEVLDVDLDKENDRMVIEGLVTNEVAPFYVKLSKTVALDDQTDFPAVDNAFVTIGDNTGNLDTLFLVGNGIYKTNGNRQGVPGRRYFLTVQADGKTYVGNDLLRNVSPIDSLYVIYQEKGDALGISEDGYYAYFNSTDPPNEKNYYMEEVSKNGTTVIRSNQIAIFDDRFLAPVIQFARLPGRFETGEKVVFRLSSLSEEGYNYLNGIALQLQNDGGFFSTPPANAPTNLSEGALGYFRASAVSVDSLIVP